MCERHRSFWTAQKCFCLVYLLCYTITLSVVYSSSNTPDRLGTECAFFYCSKGTEFVLCAQSVYRVLTLRRWEKTLYATPTLIRLLESVIRL